MRLVGIGRGLRLDRGSHQLTWGPEYVPLYERAAGVACGAPSSRRGPIASNTSHGLRAIHAKSTRAGPVGYRRRCSQLRSVLTDTPIAFANDYCVAPMPRVARRMASFIGP
jgi:hypothetical protein